MEDKSESPKSLYFLFFISIFYLFAGLSGLLFLGPDIIDATGGILVLLFIPYAFASVIGIFPDRMFGSYDFNFLGVALHSQNRM